MVRIINIDTKTRTIRVSNGKDDLEWFTTDTGSHVPLKKGQSKAEAIKEHFGGKNVGGNLAAKKAQLHSDFKSGKITQKQLEDGLNKLAVGPSSKDKTAVARDRKEREETFKAQKEADKSWQKQQPAKHDKVIEEEYTEDDLLYEEARENIMSKYDDDDIAPNGYRATDFMSPQEYDARQKRIETEVEKEFKRLKAAKQQPAKKAEQPAKEEKNDHTERDLNKIPISQMTPAEKKYMWDLEQKKYEETQKNIAKDTIVGLRKMIEKTNKLIANFEKDGQQAEVDGLTGYRDELEKSIKEITKIHRL